MKKIGTTLFILILSLFLFAPGIGIKQLSGELKSQANLPDDDQIISLDVAKNQTQSQFNLDNSDPGKLVYYSIVNLGKRTIKPQVIINGQDWFTNQSIADYALKNLNQQTANNEEKVIALLNFVVNNRYHWPPPLYETSYYFLENPVRYFNIWGYGYCSNSASVLIQLLSLTGFEVRLVNLIDHVVSEVFYNGQWHVLDPDREVYYRNFKGEIASVEDIVVNNEILDSPTWIREVNDTEKKIIWELQVISFSKPAQRNTPVKVSMTSKDYQDELVYRLRSNEEIRFYYDFKDKYYWGFESKSPPDFTNGVLISKNKGGYFRFVLPYLIVNTYIYRPNLCRAIVKARFSLDGTHWKKLTDCRDDTLNLTDLFPIGEGSYPTEKYFLVLPFSLAEYQLLTQFQVAPKSIPKPNFGINDIETRNPLDSDIQLKFGYARAY